MGESVLTAMLDRRGGTLSCEGVALDVVAEAAGTPAYVYSSASIREQYLRLEDALSGVRHKVHYSLKANANPAVLRLLRSLGAGADVVSGGELYRARRAGFAPEEIVFGGVGKTRREIAEALGAGIKLLNVESEEELRVVDEAAAERGVRAPVALRINPEITVGAFHAYTATGERGRKFGIPYDEAHAAARLAARLPHVALIGLDMHVGSQIAKVDAYERGVTRMLELLSALREDGIDTLQWLDIGGGLAVPYEDETPADLESFGHIVRAAAARVRSH